jgi:hypothetical protein
MLDEQEKRLNALESADKLILQQLQYLTNKVDTLSDDFKAISKELQFEQMAQRFVPLDRYKNIERIVYGMVGLILMTFATYLVNIVFNG